MNITLQIANNGLAAGTIGWLCANMASIKIGTTKAGKQGAWLIDREGKTITPLAVRDYWGVEEYRSQIQPVVRNGQPEELVSKVAWTDAAWVIIARCAALAIEAMEESATLAEELSVTVCNRNRPSETPANP